MELNAEQLLGNTARNAREYSRILDRFLDTLQSVEGEIEENVDLYELLTANDNSFVMRFINFAKEENSDFLQAKMLRVLSSIGDIFPELYELLQRPECSIIPWLGRRLNTEERGTGDLDKQLSDPVVLKRILDIAVERADEEEDNTICFASLRCMFAINKMYRSSLDENPVLRELESRSGARSLGNEIIALFNRGFMITAGEDPFAKDMCMKFLNDIYSNVNTANFFFANDMKVLIDILLQEIHNCEASDINCARMIAIIYKLLMNCTDYCEFIHRGEDILKMANAFSMGGDPRTAAMARKILDTCSGLLQSTPSQ